MLGVLSSLTTVFLQITSFEIIIVVALLTSVSFGLGLPVVMALFAEGTRPENRGRTSAVVLLSFSFATIALKLALTENIVINALVLASWRATGFIAFLLLRQHKKIDAEKSSSFVQILKTRQFFLYLVPWAIFSLVNYLAWSINMEFLGEDFIHFLTSIENIIAGIFALIAGFVSDIFGRKRLLMAGFVIFGLGYAVLGVFPLNIYSWYLYTVMDGVAWGIIYIIFLFTIWGDLAEGKPSEKHYALGLLPSSLSSFLHLTVGSFVATAVSPYAIFSFAAFFLFLAVLPLMYAPETLPEKTLKDRELRQYIDKAKKAKEKYA
ncbi:MAG: MFS transporter [Candidatus Bathyarchaeia archaeon]